MYHQNWARHLENQFFNFMQKDDNYKQFGEESPDWWRTRLRVLQEAIPNNRRKFGGDHAHAQDSNNDYSYSSCQIYMLYGLSALQRNKFLLHMKQAKDAGKLAELLAQMFNAPGPLLVEDVDEAKIVEGIEKTNYRASFYQEEAKREKRFPNANDSYDEWLAAWAPFMYNSTDGRWFGDDKPSILDLWGHFWLPGSLENKDYLAPGLMHTLREGYKAYLEPLLRPTVNTEALGHHTNIDFVGSLYNVQVDTQKAVIQPVERTAVRIRFHVRGLSYKQITKLHETLVGYDNPSEAMQALFGLPAPPVTNAENALILTSMNQIPPEAQLTITNLFAYDAAAEPWREGAEWINENLPPVPPQNFSFSGAPQSQYVDSDDDMAKPAFRSLRADEDAGPGYTSLGAGDDDEGPRAMDTRDDDSGGASFSFSGSS
jgi:hypothetical protein